jgi:hypothetical protein
VWWLAAVSSILLGRPITGNAADMLMDPPDEGDDA